MNDNGIDLLQDIIQTQSQKQVELTQHQVDVILSLQNMIEKRGYKTWKVKNKKKYGGKLNINKFSKKYFNNLNN